MQTIKGGYVMYEGRQCNALQTIRGFSVGEKMGYYAYFQETLGSVTIIYSKIYQKKKELHTQMWVGIWMHNDAKQKFWQDIKKYWNYHS